MTRIAFDPYIPLALWVPLALGAAGLLTGYALASRGRLAGRRRWGVMSLMAAALTVPLALLLNPTWMERVPPPPGKPLLTVLVDASASMAVRDASGGQTRFQEAAEIAQAMAAALEPRYEIRVRRLAADSAAVAPEALGNVTPDGAATDLAGAIALALDDQRPQGQALLLLSDGIYNVGGPDRLRETMSRAKALAAPVYSKTIGGPAEVRDLEVGLKRPQEVAFVHQRVPVSVTLRQRGSLGPQANLKLLLDGKEIERRQAKLTPNGTSEEVFHVVQNSAGLFRYEVRAEPLPGEVSEANNSASLLLRVVDQPVRVLLLEGKPYWDTKFLIRSLASDESVELTAVVQLAAGRLLQRKIARPGRVEAAKPDTAKAGGLSRFSGEERAPPSDGRPRPENGTVPLAPAQPPAAEQWTIQQDAGRWLADPAALASYQVVILGRGAEVFLREEALQGLRKWLNDEDRSLVCFRGAPSSEIGQRLGELMPVRWSPGAESRFGVQWTDEGQALRWLSDSQSADPLAGMPSLAATTRAEVKPYVGVVLATSGGKGNAPVVTYRQAGASGGGRVVVIEGAGMWRWAFLPPEQQDRDELYGSLWRSLLRWLVTNTRLLPSQRMALWADRAAFTTDDVATATLLVRENQWSGGTPQIEVSGPTLAAPRAVSCKPWGNAPGQYHVELGKLAEGRYQIRVAGARSDDTSGIAALEVRGNLRERLDVRARPDNMAWISQASGGEVIDRAEPEVLARQFEAHLSRSRPERIVRTFAWDRWWVLLGGLVLWGGAWGLRRASGLI